ncbi:MAG: hypothetical protein RSE94_11740 [Pseudomonas sp.]
MHNNDYLYILKRLNLRADQPAAHALRQVLVDGLPFGPVAKAFGLTMGRVSTLLEAAKPIVASMTISDQEATGKSPNEILAYARRRELGIAEGFTITADQLRAAGLTEEQIAKVLA